MNEMLASYIEDLKDNLITFNEALIEVQNGARDSETVNSIFRVAHTIKGNSAAMGFNKIQQVMHTMEDLLSEVRNGARELTDPLVDLLFQCHDFLEDSSNEVQQSETDEAMDNEALLAALVEFKTGKPPEAAPAAAPQAAAPAAPALPDTLGVTMPAEMWEVMADNLKMGYSAYKLTIQFVKNCSMKAVRAWMIFESIENNAVLVYSKPERISDDQFGSGSMEFDDDTIEVVILSDKEISGLVEEINSCVDIESVAVTPITDEQVRARLSDATEKEELASGMREVSVQLLGIEKQPIDGTIIATMIDRIDKLLAAGVFPESHPATISLKRLGLAVREVQQEQRRVDMDESNSIIYIFQSIEEMLQKPELENDKAFVSELYSRLDELIEAISQPERRIGDILTEKALLKEQDVAELLSQQKDANLKFGQLAVKSNKVGAYEVATALKKPEPEKTPAAAPSGGKAPADGGFIRVPVQKVDSLIDMLSELLIYNSQLEQSQELTMGDEDNTVVNILSRTGKLIKEIQSLSMSLRMVEIKPTLHRLTRIARDTASDLGKKIAVHIEGEDTEIDRSAVEKIFDPLMHLVRNAVSHGIEESEADRLAVGKRPEGQVTIAAYSKRGNVYIEVKDDGRGINTQAVYDKAKKQGLLVEGREYTDDEIFKFIFLPGFSTQEQVNTVSGRGVGMNVVEEVVVKLGGKVEVESEMGKGSSFIIKLPINLAVVNGTIVEICGQRYIIPTMCTRQFVIAQRSDLISLQGKKSAIKVGDSVVPIVPRDKVFGLVNDTLKFERLPDPEDGEAVTDSESADICEMVVLEVDQKLLVLPVDRIITRQDVVSKPLNNEFANIGYSSSASILGDGMVSLILDVEAIFKMNI